MVFLRAAMGVKSSGSLLAAALANCLAPIQNNCITYSYNLVLHATESTGPALLDSCFKLLIKGGYKIKKSKALIHVQQPIRILGIMYNIINKHMHLDHEKTTALSEMDPPNNLKILKSYLGGVQFLVSAMAGCGEYLATLYKCTRQGGYEFPFAGKELQAFHK